MIYGMKEAMKCRATVGFSVWLERQVLCLTEPGADESVWGLVIAAPSWTKDADGFITWPPTGHYREGWLCECVGGDFPPRASVLRQVLAEFFASADLSSLLDADDFAGHRALCDSLDAAIAKGGAFWLSFSSD